MKATTWLMVLGAAVLVNTSACSRIKSYFPDKQKEYQYTTQIPPLQLPSDLQNNAIVDKPLVAEPLPRPRSPVYDEDAKPVVETTEDFIPVELVDFDGGATRLRIEEPMVRAWRLVGKALSRHSIEITSRNEQEHLYVVQYDPDAQKVEDGAIWDELVFFSGRTRPRKKNSGSECLKKTPA
nr:outer membrane protein assembly factor BamC [Methylomarinum sp. Ch1-1]MDP4520909.1 outer membrane protein assembly factor BamC [Methylomarinum sp. Ch1-1]